MRRTLLPLLLAAALPVWADPAAHRALAAEYLELAHYQATTESAIDSYADEIAKQTGQPKEKARQLLEAVQGWKVIREPLIDIVTQNLSEAQLKGINIFFKSDDGRALADKSPVITSALTRIISQNMNKLQQNKAP